MQSDHFAVHSDHIVVNDDDADSTALSIVVRSADLSTETLMIHDRFESQHTRSVYGDFAINDDNPRGVYQWTFVIAENHSNIAIGICTTTKYVDNWYTWKIGKDSLEEFYAFGYGRKKTKEGQSEVMYPELTPGDTVIMQCDIKAQSVSFTVNEDPRVALFEGIDYSKTYKMAIVMCDEGDAVKLMSFERWNSAQQL